MAGACRLGALQGPGHALPATHRKSSALRPILLFQAQNGWRVKQDSFVNSDISLTARTLWVFLHTGYTKEIEEVTGSIGYFRCEGVEDLSMFEGLVRLGGSFTVNVR